VHDRRRPRPEDGRYDAYPVTFDRAALERGDGSLTLGD
jgi:hypothetical protein